MKEGIYGFAQKHEKLFFLICSVLFGFACVAFGDAVSSFLYPHFRSSEVATDPYFFYYCAEMLVKGKTPYYDFYDHKGLYIFWFNAIGILMGGKVGLFFWEWLYFIPTFFFLFLIYKEYKLNLKLSLSLNLLFAALLIFMFQDGSEENVLLPWVTMPLYFYIKALSNDDMKSFSIGNLLWGIEAGIAINMRPSDASYALSMVIFYAVYCFRRKRFLPVLRDAGICLGALILTCVPAVVVSAAGGYLEIMIDSTIFANFRYAATHTSGTYILYVVGRSVVLLALVFYVIGIASMKEKIGLDERLFYYINGIINGAILVMISVYIHYWIVAFPFCVVFLGRLIGLAEKPTWKKRKTAFHISMNALFLFSCAMWGVQYYGFGQAKMDQSMSTYLQATIPEKERDGYTLCIDTRLTMYLVSDMRSHFKHYTMQTMHAVVTPSVKTETWDYIYSGKVHYVVFTENGGGGSSYYEQIAYGHQFDLVGSIGDNPYVDVFEYRGTWVY